MLLLTRSQIQKLSVGTRFIHVFRDTKKDIFTIVCLGSTCSLDEIGGGNNKYYLPVNDDELLMIENMLKEMHNVWIYFM